MWLPWGREDEEAGNGDEGEDEEGEEGRSE